MLAAMSPPLLARLSHSRAATGRRSSARSAGSARASTPRQSSNSPPRTASGADTVAACNALGLFGAGRRPADPRRRRRALAEGATSRRVAGYLRARRRRGARARRGRSLRGSTLAELCAKKGRCSATTCRRRAICALGGGRAQASRGTADADAARRCSSSSSATTRVALSARSKARRVGRGEPVGRAEVEETCRAGTRGRRLGADRCLGRPRLCPACSRPDELALERRSPSARGRPRLTGRAGARRSGTRRRGLGAREVAGR